MASERKTIYVYDSFSGIEPNLLGRLYVNIIRGGESYSFEYEKEWLKQSKMMINLDPELIPYEGRQYPQGKEIFGLFADASPDRWGRVLMNKRERILAEREGRKPKKLFASDYLLGVYDKTRMGGLQFKTELDGPFVSDDKDTPVPPWTALRTLEEASRNYEKDETGFPEKWIAQLMRPGSSLGGARPKATVMDEKGQLWIAKFPSKNDENDTGAWEKTVYDLAGMCGLRTVESKMEKFSNLGSTFLVKRFDRDGDQRIHFASAMTLLGETDGASAAEGVSYLDIASFIKSSSADPKRDLLELWKRIVFNMAVTNTDDHLRNHAFILSDQGWRLSPLYDVNPVPYGDELALNVDEKDNTISTKLAIKNASKFGLTEARAKEFAEEIISIVQDNWERLALKNDLSRGQINHMRPAFSLRI
ncbi:MAG: type II toxin-antitoxin system HipA family toxin [Lachnospiraceae bacterium]|nr:type II toxin-antitoxin system HipA family toxin [Lachnospiraceae bacterium]